MMDRQRYIELLADLLNRQTHPSGERERRVRQANQELFRAVVTKRGGPVQADLALAEAAALERRRAQSRDEGDQAA